MATLFKMPQKQWDEWVKTRPKSVQKLARKFPPNKLYRIKPKGQRVTIHSYSEDGTLTVNVTGEYNAVVFDRQVFGMKPRDLEECDLPPKDEKLGTMTKDPNEIRQLIKEMRKQAASKAN